MNRIKILLSTFVLSLFALNLSAQEVTVAEPDTASADLIYWVTSSNELKALPLETGEIKEHKNKFGKIAGIVGNVADATGALGGIGSIVGAHTGSINTVLNGIQIMGTAGNVADLAGVADALAGAEGHDFTYKGANSPLVINPNGKDVKILVNLRCEKKEDGLALLKVVRFKATKKDRRLRWFQSKAALIDTEKSDEADKAGYLSFGFENYGEHCSLLTIPAASLEPGEYGVYCYANMFGPSLAILCYTFSVH